ncbi:AMP-binding protein [Paracoccus sp. YIM 132242]|uniref:AMP-binding protein n=2 Tax=Paracoccus lichenicola TaxID=2665644 RepID=A0A6L6HPN2_9RHOB|nr:AMP-binding protein [Paracoccus lichenicola]
MAKECWSEVLPLGDLLVRAATLRPDRDAVVFPNRRCSYAELLTGAERFARGLVALGIGPRDHVGLLAANSVEFLEGLFGALLLGCVVVPINARHRAVEIRHIVVNAELRAILTTSSDDEYVSFTELLTDALPSLEQATDPTALSLPEAPALRVAALLTGSGRPGFVGRDTLDARAETVSRDTVSELRARVRVRDIAMILYTSGTTSNPKGCLLAHEALMRGTTERARTRFSVGDHDVIWNGGPLFHIAAFGPLIGSIGAMSTFLTDTFYDPERAVALMRREGVTMAWPWFPAILQGLFDQPDFSAEYLPTLRRMMLIVPEAMIERLSRQFPETEFLQACGMTETSGIFAISAADETLAQRATTQGKAVPGIEVRIVDPETGLDLSDGQVGEIMVRGYCVTEGYYRDPEKTAEVLSADGWLRTGDMYVRTPEGSLIFQGRYKDMLKVGGENVAAIEIEAFLCGHPAVRIAEVVGRPDPRLDEVPVAFVELQEGKGATAEELIAFCTGRIARYKVPREIRFVRPGEWPMSATKVNKRVLRQWLQDGSQ